jgi:hypothetical protein
MRIRDPGWKKFGSGIRDKHPGVVTLVFIHIFLQTASVEHPKLFYPDPNPTLSRSFRIRILPIKPNKMRYRNWQIFYVPIITGLLQDFFPTAFTGFSKEMTVPMYVNKNDLGNLQNLNQILHIFFCQKVRFPDPVQLFRIHI